MSLDAARPAAVYHNLKVGLNFWMDRLLQACNNVLINEDKIRPVVVRVILARMVHAMGALALLIKQLPRVDAFEVTALLENHDVRVIYLGDAHGADAFKRLLFDPLPSAVKQIDRVKLWETSALARHWLSQGAQLVVCDSSPLVSFLLHGAAVPHGPRLLRQEIGLPADMEKMLAQPALRRTRRSLNRAQRAGFQWRFSQDPADFDLYYHRMYLPYITKRFGSAAFVMPYAAQRQEFDRGGLVMVTLNGEPAAAMLAAIRSAVCYFLDAGILDASEELLQQGVFTFNLWALACWGCEQGAARLDLGGAASMRSDGVFLYKKNWGAEVKDFRRIQNHLFYIIQQSSPEFLTYMNQKGIVTQHSAKFYGLIFGQNDPEPDPSDYGQETLAAHQDGLAGLCLISPERVRYIDAAPSNL